MSIQIDLSRDSLFDQLGLTRLRESYMLPTETSPQERFAFVSEKFSSNPEHAQRLYDYSSKHWLSYATPLLSYGNNPRALPISCFLSFLEDSSDGLVDTYAEVSRLSMAGGGVGIHVRSRGTDEKSVGVMPHLKTYDAGSLAYKQNTRRGSYAVFLDIDHPDILKFIQMRKATGDQNQKAMNLNHGVNITDKFMQIIEKCMLDSNYDDSWDLIQPNSGKVVQTVSAKQIWQDLLEIRMQTGEPYLIFIDTANAALRDYQKAAGLKIYGSNLCTEIFLPTNSERTAVCCLSSVNAEKFDEWKDNPLFIQDVMEMLDNALQVFIDTAPKHLKRAIYSAMRERSVGLGLLGFHAYLQQKNVPFESATAAGINQMLFSKIRAEADAASIKLAQERGSNPDAADAGVVERFTHKIAVAPNASSSLIMGNTSPSIEPFRANAYRQDTTSGVFINKNKYLDKIIQEEAKNHKEGWAEEQWSAIIADHGSAQNLSWLSDWHKDVYKTAFELDQRWIIQHAIDRQTYIDQGQSVNIFGLPNISILALHAVHFMAWKGKLKSLYYNRSDKLRKADAVSKRIERVRIEDEINLAALVEDTECLSCQG